MKKYLASLVGLLVGASLTLLYFHYYSGNDNEGCFVHINPEVDCDTSSTVHTVPVKNVVANKMHELEVAGKATSISAYYLSLSNYDHEWFTINNSRVYYPASYSKLPILMWFYSQDEAGSNVMNDVVDYKGGQYNGKQYFDYGGITPGRSYTVPELLESMIVNSDNNAALALAQIMGTDELSRTLSDLGLRLFNATSTSYKVDVKTAATLFRMLYDSSYLTPEDSEKALVLLSHTKFDKGIKAGLPPGIEFAHKFGEWAHDNVKQLHDCGIVYKPNHPYLICFMTEGSDFDTLSEVLKELSQITYDSVKN